MGAVSLPLVVFGLIGFGLAMAGFGSYVATAKGRSFYEGAAFGLVLGPLGILIVALLPTIVDDEEGDATTR